MKNELFKVRTGMKWCGWDEDDLARSIEYSSLDVHSALSGNKRSKDMAVLRSAIAEIQNELGRQCKQLCAKYGVVPEEVLSNLF